MCYQKSTFNNNMTSKQRGCMTKPTSSRRMSSTSSASSSTSTSSSSYSSSRRNPKQSASRFPVSHQQRQSDFLPFQPALQNYYSDTSRRSSPRHGSNNNLNSKSYCNTNSSAKAISSSSMMTSRPGCGNKPFASAKYLELPLNADLPAPPADWITAKPVKTTEKTLFVAPPPSPTTSAAVAFAKENGFDGRIRLSPLQLIAAVCAS